MRIGAVVVVSLILTAFTRSELTAVLLNISSLDLITFDSLAQVDAEVFPCEASGTRHDMGFAGVTPSGVYLAPMVCEATTMSHYVSSIRGGEQQRLSYIKLEDLEPARHSTLHHSERNFNLQDQWLRKIGQHVMKQLMPRAREAQLNKVALTKQRLAALTNNLRMLSHEPDREALQRLQYLKAAVHSANTAEQHAAEQAENELNEQRESWLSDYQWEILDFITDIKWLGWTSLLNLFGLWSDEDTEGCEESWALWVGANGSKTALHYDKDSINYLYVIRGRKKVVIFPHSEGSPQWHQCDGGHFDANSCWTGNDVLSHPPDHATVVYVGPGEALEIPFLYWHSVENLEPSIAVSYRLWCESVAQAPVSSADFKAGAATSTGESSDNAEDLLWEK